MKKLVKIVGIGIAGGGIFTALMYFLGLVVGSIFHLAMAIKNYLGLNPEWTNIFFAFAFFSLVSAGFYVFGEPTKKHKRRRAK